MELFEALKSRRSIRKFTNEPVYDEDIYKIIDAARQAPSGNNRQPWNFIVIRKEKVIEEMAQAVHERMDELLNWPETKGCEKDLRKYRYLFTFFTHAPVVIAIVVRHYKSSMSQILEKRGFTIYHHSDEQSVAAAVQNLLLAAHALGYGACWMTGPLVAIERLEEILNIEDGSNLMALVPLGRPARIPPPQPRRSLKEIVRFIE